MQIYASFKRRDAMKVLILIVFFAAVWYVVNRFILPYVTRTC